MSERTWEQVAEAIEDMPEFRPYARYNKVDDTIEIHWAEAHRYLDVSPGSDISLFRDTTGGAVVGLELRNVTAKLPQRAPAFDGPSFIWGCLAPLGFIALVAFLNWLF